MKKVILLILAAAFILSFASCKKNKGHGNENEGGNEEEPKLTSVDFLRDDLSEYVEIDEKYYKGYTVKFNPDIVSTIEVENKIIQTLRKYKSA